MKGLAIIPARGGSKRIPHKNIKDFRGLPLIAYSIKAAQESNLFSDIIVSSDDPEIIEVAKKYGALTPFIRDKNIADDHTGTFPVFVDAYKKMKELGKEYSFVTGIYATAPLLTAKYLLNAFDMFNKDKVDYLYACCEFSFPIQRAQYLDENKSPKPVMPEFMSYRSQDLPKAYQDAGQFYMYSIEYIEKESIIDNPTLRGFEIPRHRVIDIDTPEDWEYAQMLAFAIEELKLD